MPAALSGFFLLGLTSLGAGATTLGIAVPLLTYGTLAAGTLGLSALASSLLKNDAAVAPEDAQSEFRQSVPSRCRHYGRVKISGPWVFAEAYQGVLYKVIYLGEGQLDDFETLWIDDSQVIVSSGNVITDPYTGFVTITTRLGLETETSYSALTSLFPDWDVNCRGDGCASMFITQDTPSQEDYYNVFPNGVNTNYRVVVRGSLIKNPVTNTTGWNDNAAAVIRDYLCHPTGMRLPESLLQTPKAQAGWVAAYNRCAEAVPLAAGGNIARYKLWGTYYLNERPADVLGRMLACCDGRLIPTSDGGLTLDIGAWAEPTVVIGTEDILGFDEFGRGGDILTTANTIRATYLDPTGDFQTSDAEPWVMTADVADRGEIVSDESFIMAPHHSQARRLMKLAAYRANPKWAGTFECSLKAMQAIDRRLVRIQFAPFGVNEVFEVLSFKINVGEGGLMKSVTLSVQSMPAAAYNWNAATEEN
jgi:hypothetical protein